MSWKLEFSVGKNSQVSGVSGEQLPSSANAGLVSVNSVLPPVVLVPPAPVAPPAPVLVPPAPVVVSAPVLPLVLAVVVVLAVFVVPVVVEGPPTVALAVVIVAVVDVDIVVLEETVLDMVFDVVEPVVVLVVVLAVGEPEVGEPEAGVPVSFDPDSSELQATAAVSELVIITDKKSELCRCKGMWNPYHIPRMRGCTLRAHLGVLQVETFSALELPSHSLAQSSHFLS